MQFSGDTRGYLATSSIRVLVVDDYEPFRRFACSTLEQSPYFQIIGEASDGLRAVKKAEELQPDLVVLDIGLPRLNGIEAARRIRKLCPASRILFVSQEFSRDVVQEALSVGALGYVIKADAQSELLAAAEMTLPPHRREYHGNAEPCLKVNRRNRQERSVVGLSASPPDAAGT